MKRNLALLLAFSMLLAFLTGCEHFAGTGNERPPLTSTEEPTEESTENSTEEPTNAPTDGSGAGAVVENYGFTVFPEGNYLADPKFDTDEYLPDYDADLSFVQHFSTGDFSGTSPLLCATEDTVYYYDMEHKLIMYLDKGTGITGPLCGRPECMHDGSSCNAYVAGPAGMRVYDGKLYWAGGRMNLDGTDREKGPWNRNTGGMNDIPTTVIHRGYVYTASAGQTASAGNAQYRAVVNATNMETGETFNVLTRDLKLHGAACEIRPVRNDLYIMTYGFLYYDEDDHSAGSYDDIEIFRWDSKTRQAELVFQYSGKETGLNFSKETFMPVPGDGIYLRGEYGYDQAVCKYSFETKEIEELLRKDYNGREQYRPVYTKDYIVLDYSNGTLGTEFTYRTLVYDYAWNLIADKSNGGLFYSYFMGIDEDYIYGYMMGTIDPETHIPMGDIGRYFMIPLGDGNAVAFGEGPMR